MSLSSVLGWVLVVVQRKGESLLGLGQCCRVMRTPQSALVVCQSLRGGAYYRGLRLSDMATIEFTNIDGDRFRFDDRGDQHQ